MTVALGSDCMADIAVLGPSEIKLTLPFQNTLAVIGPTGPWRSSTGRQVKLT
jgi:hypothetical protein